MNKIYQKKNLEMKNRVKSRLGGFTLIELLVVVLIIGILAAIALPQYTTAVEKARLSEVFQNMRTMEESLRLHMLSNPSEDVSFYDIASVELSGGVWKWNNQTYETKYFSYSAEYHATNHYIGIEVHRLSDEYEYALLLEENNGNLVKECWTQDTEMGKKICKQLQGNGWSYVEGYR